MEQRRGVERERAACLDGHHLLQRLILQAGVHAYAFDRDQLRRRDLSYHASGAAGAGARTGRRRGVRTFASCLNIWAGDDLFQPRFIESSSTHKEQAITEDHVVGCRSHQASCSEPSEASTADPQTKQASLKWW